jgi:hypothetical protein
MEVDERHEMVLWSDVVAARSRAPARVVVAPTIASRFWSWSVSDSGVEPDAARPGAFASAANLHRICATEKRNRIGDLLHASVA